MGSVTLRVAKTWATELDLLFPTQKAKKDACSRILNHYELKRELRGLPKIIVLGALANHDRAEEKFGDGVVKVTIEHTTHGARGFHLHHANGTSIDISYIKAITNPAPRRDIMDACRQAIEPRITKFRDAQLAENPTCAITGWPLTADSANVHHAPPMFDVLVDSWLDQTSDLAAVTDHLDRSGIGVRLTGRMLSSWLRYHDKHAHLQLVHETANNGVEGIRRKIGAS